MLDFSFEDEGLLNSDDDDIPFLAAVATYMRRHLPRNKGFFGTNRKIMFHLQPNRNFRNLLVNGKHPLFQTKILAPRAFSLAGGPAKVRPQAREKALEAGSGILVG